MPILHLNQRNQRNQILFQYSRDKKKKRKKGAQENGVGGGVGGLKIHPFHLPWIRACKRSINDHKCTQVITNLYCMAELVSKKKGNSDWFS